jgi:hypothetical protein
MVAICTGPAFSTDDNGNLILAGERSKAKTSPCALSVGNGLYTDPNGGVWTPDQVSLTYENEFINYSTATVANGAHVLFPSQAVTITNPECWAMQVHVSCAWIGVASINANGTMWFEVGASVGSPVTQYVTVGAGNYWPGATAGAPPTFDFTTAVHLAVTDARMEPQTSVTVNFGAQMIGNAGAGGALQRCHYRVTAHGFAVI